MFNFHFGHPNNHLSSDFSVSDFIKPADTKPSCFNNTISTVNSDSAFLESFEKPETRKQGKKSHHSQGAIQRRGQSFGYIIDQDYYEIVYPILGPLHEQPRARSSTDPSSGESSRASKDSASPPTVSSYFVRNYMNYIWQVGDEFSEVHSLPLY
ncbi:hypothetical protein OJ252_2032 [Cryptosporidium canis]|uniref:Uncharacterized protein n=1 Tax=Cryptosporidium canis TaxID=195482 RepID=A0ABQ8P759_9CRYT|nr:hypothetical protein OJ252_2032 [Cryptosporidium canis]